MHQENIIGRRRTGREDWSNIFAVASTTINKWLMIMNWLHAIYVVGEIHSMKIVVDCVERRPLIAHLKVNQWLWWPRAGSVSLLLFGAHCLFCARASVCVCVRAAGSFSCPLALPVDLVCTVKRNNNNNAKATEWKTEEDAPSCQCDVCNA